MHFKDTATLFLQSLGRHEEVEHYLKRFRSVDSEIFALIVPDQQVIESFSETFHYQLQSLYRMGLSAGILLCGPLLKDKFQQISTVYSDIFTEFSISEFTGSTSNKTLPLLYSQKPLIHTIPELASITKRIYFVREQGAFVRSNQSVNICWIGESEVQSEDYGLYTLAKDLKQINQSFHLSVTSPYLLLKEIFTVKGAGTLIREPMKLHVGGPDSISKDQLLKLLEDSFQRKLADTSFLNQIYEIVYEDQLRGAAVIEKPNHYPYLSKFAVGVDARGDGVGQFLWDKMLSRYSSLFWRSSSKNTIHRWYEKIADGFHRTDTWNIYWRGVEPEHIGELIQYCQNRPADFSDFTLPESPVVQTD